MPTIKPIFANVPKIPQPLFLKPEDKSPQAQMKRFTLMQAMSIRTGGKGFREAPSSDHHPMKKSKKPTTRMEMLGMSLAPFIEAEDRANIEQYIRDGKRSK